MIGALFIHESNFNNYKIVKNTSSIKQNNCTTSCTQNEAERARRTLIGKCDWKSDRKCSTWRMRRRFAAVFFEGGPLSPVWSFRSVGPKCSFPFDKIVVPSTAPLYAGYKNNNQMRGGLGRVCATRMYRSIGLVNFRNFKSEFLLNGKRPWICGLHFRWRKLPCKSQTSLFQAFR